MKNGKEMKMIKLEAVGQQPTNSEIYHDEKFSKTKRKISKSKGSKYLVNNFFILNSSETPMHRPSLTNLDDIVQCDSFQEALCVQVKQMKNQHAQEVNVMKEEKDKLQAESVEMREQFHSRFDELMKQQQTQMEEMRRIQEAQYCELCKRLRVKPMEIQSSSGGVYMEHHTIDSDDEDDDAKDEDDQSEEEQDNI
ncbi:hypothetical protein M9H77_17417 [Catharanthus roseus]|uniref:Uncharacterized protein n=1 Tax=Catharanthus roseus TaxID=4058 RepID=A0ACC0B4I8_CATRO|nr:hypothetical protein M9H77_17417 [Catharanthus roseus]